jgi:hypothetical protein
MSKLTKPQLIDQLAALREHADKLETKLASVTRERDEAVDGLHRLKSELLAAKLPAVIVPRRTPEHKLPEHMRKARELAMTRGIVVRVG